MMQVKVIGGALSPDEVQVYVDAILRRHPEQIVRKIEFTLHDDFVDVRYEYDNVPFERIRRITGYLVGSLDRFNDAKRAEESERVKHTTEEEAEVGHELL